MQDWDIELADPARVEEFCDIYESELLTNDEKAGVMKLIVASFDVALCQEEKASSKTWERICQLLLENCVLHSETIEYWSLLDETDEENVFPVTLLMRLVWQSCRGEALTKRQQ